MVALRDLPKLGDALDRLAGALEALAPGPDSSALATERDRLARTIRNYLIPRAEDRDIPLTVVFAGPTGSGKSTLINTLTGLELSIAGPLRPTTTAPVVLTVEERGDDFETIAGVDCDVVTGEAPILDTTVLIDTPDIDSTSTDHRAMAETLIDNADVVVFVTSALRYADAIPWQVLRRAESRGIDVIHVLNRVGSETRGAVVDFKARLSEAGLGDELLTVAEHHLAPGSQQVSSLAVRSLRRVLVTLARDHTNTADRVFDRVLRTTLLQVGDLEDRLSEIGDSLASLEAELNVDLSERVVRLDLSPVAQGMVPVPAGESPREMRRWRRTARRGPLTTAEAEDVVKAIVTRVGQDLRRWLVGESADALPVRVDPRHVLSVALPVTRLAMEGWIDFVRRIAEDEGRRRAGLAEAVLVVSATDPARSGAGQALFGDHAKEVISRARRELTGRLEVVYQQAGAQIVDLVESRSGEPDLRGLRVALGAVTSALAPVDA